MRACSASGGELKCWCVCISHPRNEEGGSPLFLMALCCWEDQNSFVLFGGEIMLMVRGRIQVASRCLPRVLFGMEG